MHPHVRLTGTGDLTARIYRQLREAILDGRLFPGERLPPSREYARQLDVARNTVAVAYERLISEGFLVARVGSGTYVSETVVPANRSRRRGRAAPVDGIRPRPVWADLASASGSDAGGSGDGEPVVRYDFRAGTPDGSLFPLATWRRLLSNELRASKLPLFGYDDPAGHAGLRSAIARYVGVARSVHADSDDVLVTQGAQQALDLIGRVLIEPGDRVAVEEPGYPPARRLFHGLGARVVGVPVDDEGIDVDALPADARLVYVTPSHQFPLGVPMSLARRTALLDWAVDHDAVIVEDDYDSEFRFSGRPLDPLQSLDRTGRVVYVGTFSKTLLPLLRIGFLVAPASLRAALRTAKQLADWQGDYATQAALARFIEDGELSRHVRKAARVYAARHDRIESVLRADFADWLDPVPSTAGLHLCARLRPGVDGVADVDLAGARARAAGVAVDRLERYCAVDPARLGLVLGYGAIGLADIDAGLRTLAGCFRNVPR